MPSGHDQFKPHEKSMAFGYLSQLVADIPGWIDRTLREDSINLGGQRPQSEQSTSELLASFDKLVASTREALQTTTGAKLGEDWSLTMGSVCS